MRVGARGKRVSGRSLLAGVLCAAALGLAACGGGDSGDEAEPSQPSETQTADIKAIDKLGDSLAKVAAAQDPQGLCSHIEPASLKKQFGSKKRCVKLLKTQFATVQNQPEFNLGAITVDGDTAVAEQEEEGLGTVSFVKIDGKWYIDLFPETSISPE